MLAHTFSICYARSPGSVLLSFQLDSCYRNIWGTDILKIRSEAQAIVGVDSDHNFVFSECPHSLLKWQDHISVHLIIMLC